MTEVNLQRRPSAGEFEMAYQVRVAMDRIRFAIKATEMNGATAEELTEAAMQLVDALDRLESADRRFQQRWRSANDHKPQQLDLGMIIATSILKPRSGVLSNGPEQSADRGR